MVRKAKFRIEIGANIKDDRRDLTIIDREYRIRIRKNGWKENQKWYRYICNKCGWNKGWIEESPLLIGNGCSCCYGRTPVLGINTIYDTDKWMIPYIGEEVAKTNTHQSNKKIYPVCPDCGRTKNKRISISNIYKNHSIGCPCGDNISYPNKFAFNMLEQLNINFETEKKFNWCKVKFRNKDRQGFYDFYFKIGENEYILEMDGGFHSQYNNLNNQSIRESMYIDSEKDRLAIKHNLKVIRIDSNYINKGRFEYIKNNILNSQLSILFDLTKINWNKCNEFALSNLVKIACTYKNKKPELTTTEIGTLMKLNQQTIIKYLKCGNKLGWCYYNPKEEMKKSGKKSKTHKGYIWSYEPITK